MDFCYNRCSNSSRWWFHISVSAPDMAPQIAMPIFIWPTHPQSINPQCKTVVAVSPEPGVVDVGVPMAQRDIVGIGGQLTCDRVLVMRDPRHVFAQACQELGEPTLAGSSPGWVSTNSASRVQPSFQLVRAQRRPLSHRRGLYVQWEVRGQPGRQAPGSMGACEAGQRGEQRAVVIKGFGHFVVEALVYCRSIPLSPWRIRSVISIPVPERR